MSDVHRFLLSDGVKQAALDLDDAPDGDLLLGRRQLIWCALGPRGGLHSRSHGQRRRTTLACLAGRRVLPIWIRVLPYNAMPLRALIEAERVNNGVTDLEAACKLRDRTLLALAGRADLPIEVQCAGFAAAKALTTAINDEQFDVSDVDPQLTDREIDSQHLDAAFFAASAEAGGPVWVSPSNNERRRIFWKWWLEQASGMPSDEPGAA